MRVDLRYVHALLADALDLVLEFDGKCCDVGVLALGAKRIRFTTHFLENESEVLALGATLGERVEEQLVVAPESRDFFVDVELVGHDAGFLQQADFVDFGIFHERVDAFAELDLPRFNALRVENFDLVDDFVQVDHAAGEVYGEVCAFLFAHGDDAVQSSLSPLPSVNCKTSGMASTCSSLMSPAMPYFFCIAFVISTNFSTAASL